MSSSMKQYFRKKRTSSLLILAGCIIFTTSILFAQEDKVGNQKTLLFVDNNDILYYAEVTRILRPLTRNENNPLLCSEDKSWEKYLAYNSVYRNPETGHYQMWYQSYVDSKSPDKSLRCVVCYAESQDGIHWEKPELELYPFYDIKKTNIVLVSNEGPSVHYGASVVVNPGEPDASRRYKMAYWDFVEKGDAYVKGMCIAFSPDGIHWTKYSDNPVLHGPHGTREQPPLRNVLATDGSGDIPPFALAISDVIDATYDAGRKKYVIYSKTWIDGPKGMLFWKRAIVRTESRDFVHWSRPELVMWPDEFDDGKAIRNSVSPDRDSIAPAWREKVKGAQLHGGPAFYYNDRYFSLLQVLDLEVSGLMPVELAVSRDGLHWDRPFRNDFFLPVNGGKEFDSGTIWSNATPIFLKDEIRFYYGAYIAWHIDSPAYETMRFSGIGVATMPRDRFAGLKPIEQFGQVTLKPMALSEYTSMTINADAKSGAVRVELIDQDGFRIEGFSADDAIVITGDELRHKIGWKRGRLSDLPDAMYTIRIHLDNATLYAITFLD